MVVVISSRLIMSYNSQKGDSCWRGMMTLQRSDATLEPGPLSLDLYPTNLKSTVGQYMGERTRARARKEGETAEGGMDIVREYQGGGGNGRTGIGSAVFARIP